MPKLCKRDSDPESNYEYLNPPMHSVSKHFRTIVAHDRNNYKTKRLVVEILAPA